MDWNKLHEVTAQNEKPAPGWLFREICKEAVAHPQDAPDVAEYLMRCVLSDSRTVSMKACLAIRHLADEVLTFRHYMQRCPEALEALQEVAAPPKLAQSLALESPDVKVSREAANRAFKACIQQGDREKEAQANNLRTRIQGFGNYAPPEEELPPTGAHGMMEQVGGFVGDAIADTVDDFREKGAVGALRDGVADAADLIVDGVGAFWSFLGGRKAAAAKPKVENRICCPRDVAVGIGGYGGLPAAQPGFHGQVGAAHAFCQDAFPSVSSSVAAQSPSVPSLQGNESFDSNQGAPSAPRQQSPPAELEDLLMFDDGPSPRGGTSTDLLSFDAGGASASQHTSAATSSSSGGEPRALELKGKGNTLVRQKSYTEAVKVYEAALTALGNDAAGGDEHGALRSTLYANIALCYLQQELYRRALDAATRSVALDACNAKAYYRRCLAYRALRMYEEARRDFDALQFCRHDMTPSEMEKLHNTLAKASGDSTATIAK